MGFKDFLKDAIEDIKEYSGFNDAIKDSKKILGIGLLKNFEYKENNLYLVVRNTESFGKKYKIFDLKDNMKYFSDFDISFMMSKELII